MKFLHFLPLIGWVFIWNDIPHEENQRSYKPLQGMTAFNVMIAQGIITVGFWIFLLHWFTK